MPIETLLIIATVVAATGTIWSQMLRGYGTPYLWTFQGGRLWLIACGALVWLSGIAVGLLAMAIAALFMPSTIALAIFFGIEAVALDICAHRVGYTRVEDVPRVTAVAHAGPRRPF
jgi:hypothetical protein